MTAKVKIYGERHTNTNYLSHLIRLNLEVGLVPGACPTYVRALERWLRAPSLRDRYFARTYSKNLGWKHCAVALQQHPAEVCFITLTKNPYAWLLSMFRRPYHLSSAAPTFEEFLQTPWPTAGRDNLQSLVRNPVELWNLKNQSYRNLPSSQTLYLTSEETLMDPERVISDIAAKTNALKKQITFLNREPSTKKNTDKDRAYYTDYYLNQRWRAELSDKAVSLINASVDKSLMQQYRYELV